MKHARATALLVALAAFLLADGCGKRTRRGPPQMPVWPTYLNEISRAEGFAIYGGRDPKKLLDAVQK